MNELIEHIKEMISTCAQEKYTKPDGGTRMIYDLNQLLKKAENTNDWWKDYQAEKEKVEKLKKEIIVMQDEMTERECAMYDQISKNSILERDLLVERTERRMLEEFYKRNRPHRPTRDFHDCNGC